MTKKLNETQVLQIRAAWASETPTTIQTLADQYGCSYWNIRAIITNKSWKKLRPPPTGSELLPWEDAR